MKNPPQYVHRYTKKANHEVDPITVGWSPKWMTCRTCGEAIIDASLAATRDASKRA